MTRPSDRVNGAPTLVAALVAVALVAVAAVLFAQHAGPEPLPCAAAAAYAADLATVAHLFSGHEASNPVARALVDAEEALRACLLPPAAVR